ncbi:MAG: hypothetical protein ROO71_02920 [Balneola sp.]
MDEEQVIKMEEDGKRSKWIGLILIIVGSVSFSNYEKIGGVITLIGAVVILGNCIWRRFKY